MRSVAVLLAMTLAACSPEVEVTDSTNKCVTNHHPSYKTKPHYHSVDPCNKHKRENTTTSSTSCTLKGAR